MKYTDVIQCDFLLYQQCSYITCCWYRHFMNLQVLTNFISLKILLNFTRKILFIVVFSKTGYLK